MIPQALALLAVDPAGLGGAVVRGPASHYRESLLEAFEALMPEDGPRRRVPAGITADRLLGGLDLAATLAAGRPVSQPGILAGLLGGVVTVPMAERATAGVITALIELLDQRPGPAVLALDESTPEEPGIHAALLDRLAFRLDLEAAYRSPEAEMVSPLAIAAARSRLPRVKVGPAHLEAICQATVALGITSHRAEVLTLRAARAHAALTGRSEIAEPDLEVAAALVLGPRALPVDALPPPAPEPEPDQPQDASDAEVQQPTEAEQLPDRILAAARAALPAALLNMVAQPRAGKSGGRGSAEGRGMTHGRRVGVRRDDPRRGARLDVVETLRAAAPWQRLRSPRRDRVAIRKDDFRVVRRVQRMGTTVMIAVDASGSSALHRLGEAKGAVELLLAESYVRRDRVALIGFRGTSAELILPPTRSLARARRTLAGLPGGGGTPLAAALLAGERLGRQVAREAQGGSSLFVLLTDARANVALDGGGGRARAEADALDAARAVYSSGLPSILIDTAPRPSAFARQLAAAMAATYLPLPAADARDVSVAVRRATNALERSA